MSTNLDVREQSTKRVAAIAAGLGFLVLYLLVSPVSGALADRGLPLPTASAEEQQAYAAANPTAIASAAALQTLSVLCFAVVVGVVVVTVRRTAPRRAGQLQTVGTVSVVAMLVSALVSVAIAVMADSSSADTILTLRTAGFVAGGVGNVATLGLFVVLASKALREAGSVGRGVLVLGYVAGGLAMLSLTSLVFYYANAFLPLGRLLSMIWTVAVGVTMARRSRR